MNSTTKQSSKTAGVKKENISKSKSASPKKQTKPAKKVERKYLTAVTIIAGIITLIDENGEIKLYRQRGITQIPDEVKMMLIGKGLLNREWYKLKELPRNYTISFDDSAILGRASASFPVKEAMTLAGLSRK